jgi:hypothetical protein
MLFLVTGIAKGDQILAVVSSAVAPVNNVMGVQD